MPFLRSPSSGRVNAGSIQLGDGSGVFEGKFTVSIASHVGGLDGQNGHARRGGASSVGVEQGVAVDLEAVVGGGGEGVPGVRGGGGDGRGEGDGHEAEPLPLEVLHGGSHVLLHQLRHLVLRHRHPVVVVR